MKLHETTLSSNIHPWMRNENSLKGHFIRKIVLSDFIERCNLFEQLSDWFDDLEQLLSHH